MAHLLGLSVPFGSLGFETLVIASIKEDRYSHRLKRMLHQYKQPRVHSHLVPTTQIVSTTLFQLPYEMYTLTIHPGC